jgi:hypothetical protein
VPDVDVIAGDVLMGELEDAIVALLRRNDYDLGMKPFEIAASLGADADAVSSVLEALHQEGRAHQDGFWQLELRSRVSSAR